MNRLSMTLLWLFAVKNIKIRLAKETNIFRKDFTLAEVLMTLMVVGVVATATMVILLPAIEDAQYKMAFKTIYSLVAQATSHIAADNGNSLKGVFTGNNVMRDKFAQYLNIIKYCDVGKTFGNCWHNMDGSLKYLNGSPIIAWANTSGIILNNGMLLRFQVDSGACTSLVGTIQKCGYISIDVNGWKGPNILGKDVHQIWILENSIKPLGTKGDTQENTCTISSSGNGCAAKVLMGQ
ncbi:MAG: hypothetical protein V2B14_05700 [bacterium]